MIACSSVINLAVLVALAFTLCEGARDEAVERLIGWKGESYKPESVAGDESQHASLYSSNETGRKGWIQTISWKPRATVYHNFLSDREARHIIDLAKYQMKRSQVVPTNDSNGGAIDDIRTSFGTFLRRNADPIIRAIEQRLSLWSHIPISHQEDMQVLRYGVSNKYGPHLDGLERVASVLMYLVAPEEGGETAFTDSRWAHPDIAEQAGAANFSACARGHVAFKPRRGDALLFWDTAPDFLTDDVHAMHTGCPVVKGVKWNAVTWIHGKPFQPEWYERALKEPYEVPPDPGLCTNAHAMCDEWAKKGECENNKGYMMGDDDSLGNCRLACKACLECDERDKNCLRVNREASGYLHFNETELQGL
ncbi:hypothetical protein HYH03_001839 [Edaphochlamys debaryana]|uniref:Fe2OG dioxygenase domain-containing protein n=1 Tax=Edaphochlamys debaryana TaxID=47281 RepID=A0A836C4K7_9CHLO|nr:hypothetical protein HYH03_001839 [Edaphochlamys debaryana]|eukprot:KAG2500261.1 hypothetical protein HYH03_001839 [Edaphochlamys debaryana]